MKPTSILVIFLFLFSSCAKNIYVNYSEYSNNQKASKEVGTLYLEPVRNSEMTSVTIDDNIIVSRKHVKSITIENIPEGEHHVHYSGGPWSYKEKMDEHIDLKIFPNKKTSKIIPVPSYSNGYWFYIGITGAAAIIIPLVATPTTTTTYTY